VPRYAVGVEEKGNQSGVRCSPADWRVLECHKLSLAGSLVELRPKISVRFVMSHCIILTDNLAAI